MLAERGTTMYTEITKKFEEVIELLHTRLQEEMKLAIQNEIEYLKDDIEEDVTDRVFDNLSYDDIADATLERISYEDITEYVIETIKERL